MTRISLPLAALALVLPAMMPVAAAAQSVQDFQLPPNPTPTPSISEPQVQGPVDVEAPLETTPRQTPTNTPAPAAQSSVAPTYCPNRARPPGPHLSSDKQSNALRLHGNNRALCHQQIQPPVRLDRQLMPPLKQTAPHQ